MAKKVWVFVESVCVCRVSILCLSVCLSVYVSICVCLSYACGSGCLAARRSCRCSLCVPAGGSCVCQPVFCISVSIECVLYRMCSLPCHQRLQLHPTTRSRSLCVCPYVYALMCMPLSVSAYMYALICMPSYVCPYVYIVNSCSEGENNMNMMHTL